MSIFATPNSNRERRPARVVEEARLESVYTPKGYRGFESLGLRKVCLPGKLFYLCVNGLRMKTGKFYVFILQSKKDFSFYVGQCDDLDGRMSCHFDGLSRYTASKRPWRLLYFEVYASRLEALRRERKIKGWKSRVYLEKLILERWKS